MKSLPQRVTCCIAGGGPAGVMLGFLLARAGISTLVLERHKDFFRDFRGDTIHPSTLQIMHELGLLDALLKLPHQQIRALRVLVGDTEIQVADFSHLPTVCKYIALMPQWDFLNFLAEQGRRYPDFDLHMETEATDLIVERDRVAGHGAAHVGARSENAKIAVEKFNLGFAGVDWPALESIHRKDPYPTGSMPLDATREPRVSRGHRSALDKK